MRRWRWLTAVAGLLALGCGTSVVAAWACAVWSSRKLVQTRPITEIEHGSGLENGIAFGWRSFALRGFGIDEASMLLRTRPSERSGAAEVVYTGDVPRWARITPSTTPNHSRNVQLSVLRCGWPRHCLRSGIDFNGPTMLGGVSVPGRLGRVVHKKLNAPLPLSPLWGGLAVNSLAWGAAWLGLFATFRAVRGSLRVRRGRCPRCAYDLMGERDRGCSECGWGTAASLDGIRLSEFPRPFGALDHCADPGPSMR